MRATKSVLEAGEGGAVLAVKAPTSKNILTFFQDC